MSIYIKNLEMPEFGEKIIILTSSGYVEDVSGQVIDGVEAIPVPAHGRLIDADALLAEDRQIYRMDGAAIGVRRYIEFSEIKDAPTIIPAEEEK